MTFTSILEWFLSWAANGLLNFTWWQMILVALITTHITIAAVTLYLHRVQAHRALELHPIVSHFFRFWLWLNTGMVTKEWASIHRKHHAKCEMQDDPHSPQIRGINEVLWRGSELYRIESRNADTLAKYGHGTPDDWIERNLYTKHSVMGVSLLMVIDLALFGSAGLAIWAIQTAWIPFTAAGVVNGLAHYWGYRNFEAPDASRNITPWGILIGGEELHNNHHTYPTSAKFSVKPYEFDIGWMYIRILETFGLAKAKKTVPVVTLGAASPVADEKTLEALIAHRYQMMASYATEMRQACQNEIATLRAKGSDLSVLKTAKRWLHRDADQVPATAVAHLNEARSQHPVLDKMVTMREELRQMWISTHASREQLAHDLQLWCQRAEASGIAALSSFSYKLKAVRI
jgi:stearoyl-CoA desaturase (Delta-9 desaturase)